MAVALVLLGGCAVGSERLTEAEVAAQAEGDRASLYAEQEPIAAPLTLYDAIARAVSYNLDRKVKVMEAALAEQRSDLAHWDLLPDLVADAGYRSRSNVNGASSESVLTGTESLEASTSQERSRATLDLAVTWNILDFGVSYVAARQQSNRVLIAEERKRKAVQEIVQEVRSAYWRALAAQRLRPLVEPLSARVEMARQDSRRIEELRLLAPLEALEYQRSIVDTRRQLLLLQEEMEAAKTELAALINLRPGRDFHLADPGQADDRALGLNLQPVALEEIALRQRPELRELAYETRISRDEVTKAMLSILPGIELGYGYSYDQNRFLVNNNWFEFTALLTSNLFDIVRAPARVAAGEAAEDLVEARRLAMSAAVLAQIHVAWINYLQSRETYRTAQELSDIEARIADQMRKRESFEAASPLEVILAEMNNAVGILRRDLAYADLQSAVGRIFVSLGEDPMPGALQALDLASLAAAARQEEDSWYAMASGQAALPPAEAAAPAGSAAGTRPSATATPSSSLPTQVRVVSYAPGSSWGDEVLRRALQ